MGFGNGTQRIRLAWLTFFPTEPSPALDVCLIRRQVVLQSITDVFNSVCVDGGLSVALPPSSVRQGYQANPELTDMASLASQFALRHPHLSSEAGIMGRLPPHLASI